MNSEQKIGKVYLVGAGPGDAGLITRRGFELLAECDAVVYDQLVADELIVCLPQKTKRIYAGEEAGAHAMAQEEINELLVRLAGEGQRVVRLKGGDPFIFGRGGEEALHLVEAGIPFEVVPGITAGTAGLAYAGIPATHRGKANHLISLTGHEADDPTENVVPWDDLSRFSSGTLVIYMGIDRIAQHVGRLIDGGVSPETPAAIIERGTMGTQRTITAPLAQLPQCATEAGARSPGLIVVGEVIALSEKLNWFARLPLFGHRVLVTGPAEQSRELYRLLREAGAEALPRPSLLVAPEYDRRRWARMNSRARNGDWLFLASPNGARFFLQQWRTLGKDIRAMAIFSLAVVDGATSEVFESCCIHPDLVAAKPSAVALAEEMTTKLDLHNRRVICVCSNLGDERVPDILTAAGAEVIPLLVYRLVTAHWTAGEIASLTENPPDAVLFSSGSEVAALLSILGLEAIRRLAERAVLVTIGSSTTEVARTHGIAVTAEASVSTFDGLIDTLKQNLPRTN